jgi:hypothetical protein
MLTNQEIGFAILAPGALLTVAAALSWRLWQRDAAALPKAETATSGDAPAPLGGLRRLGVRQGWLFTLGLAGALVIGAYGAVGELGADPLVQANWRWWYPAALGIGAAAATVLFRVVTSPPNEVRPEAAPFHGGWRWAVGASLVRFLVGMGAVLGTVWETTTFEWGGWAVRDALLVSAVGGVLVSVWWGAIDALAAPKPTRGDSGSGDQSQAKWRSGAPIAAAGAGWASIALAAVALGTGGGAAWKAASLYVGVAAAAAGVALLAGILRRRVTIRGAPAGLMASALAIAIADGIAYQSGGMSWDPAEAGWRGPWLWWTAIFFSPALALAILAPRLRDMPGWARVLLSIGLSSVPAGIVAGIALSNTDLSAY